MSEIQATQINSSIFEANAIDQASRGVIAETRTSQAPPPVEKSGSQSIKTKLKFQVDRESNEVTVLILDAKSHEVIRTVPPEELAELTPGDLIDLSR